MSWKNTNMPYIETLQENFFHQATFTCAWYASIWAGAGIPKLVYFQEVCQTRRKASGYVFSMGSNDAQLLFSWQMLFLFYIFGAVCMIHSRIAKNIGMAPYVLSGVFEVPISFSNT